MQNNRRHILVLIIAIGLCFAPSLRNAFVYWDDDTHVLENTLVRSHDPAVVPAIFQSTINKTYIPLSILSFNLEHGLFGFNAFFFHLDNLILHILVCLVIYGLIRRMGFDEKIAFLAALLFGVHPMHVESVAWVTARKDVLYSLFFVLAIDRYWRFLSGAGKRDYALALLCGLLSILAKPMALSLPLILVLIDWYKNKKLTRASLVSVFPFFLVIIPIAWITYSINRTPIANPPAESVLIWIWSLAFYLKTFLLPLELIPLYVLPAPVSLVNPVYVMAVAIVAVFGASLIYLRRNRLVIFAAVYFLLSIFYLLRISDVSQNLGPSIVADRFMYLPSLGFCLLFADAVIRSQKKWAKGLAAAVVMVFGLQTAAQCLVWKDDITLWDHVINHKQEAYQAYNGRAVARVKRNENALALQDFQQALTLHPNYPRVYYNRGKLFASMGDHERALADFNTAIAMNPNNHKYFLERGVVRSKRNELSEAVADYNEALRLRPDDAGVYVNRGLTYKKMGNHEAALNDYAKALELAPGLMQVYYNRGALWEETGEYTKALQDLRRAQELGFPVDAGRLQRLEDLAK
jgi:protein O-mannosyl-transferase